MPVRNSAATLLRLVQLFLLLVALPLAAAQSRPITQEPVLEVFVQEGCPHCAEAKAFLPAFARTRPGLRMVLRSLNDDPTARDDLLRHSHSAGIWPPGVPTFVFDGRVLVGFNSPETTGPLLAELVDRDRRPGAASSPACSALSAWPAWWRRRSSPSAAASCR